MKKNRVKTLGNDRRSEIIMAAQKILSNKGLVESNISEIAKEAGVVDSIIYHYFKNKEDLLFHALGERMREITKELNLHLEGIIDPGSKLSKMIWYHLYINDLSPTDTRVLKNLLFECRANKSFYSHPGYEELRKYTGIMLDVLHQGIKSELFRSDLNMRLVRDMIFGLLDEESLNCLASHELDKTLSDFPGIMDLIFAMILKDNNREEVLDEDKEVRILQAAELVFAGKGYNAATMSEIASTARVAEGTIYTYFKNKNDLLFSISKKRFQYFKESTREIFAIKDPMKKLRRIIRYHFSSFLSDRNFLKVFLLDIKLNREFYESTAYKDFLDYNSILEDTIEEGKEKGIFRKNVSKRLFRNLFFGAFTHLTTRWLILEKAKAIDMMQEIDEVISLLCRSVVKENIPCQRLVPQITA